jgi:hypothetical protein
VITAKMPVTAEYALSSWTALSFAYAKAQGPRTKDQGPRTKLPSDDGHCNTSRCRASDLPFAAEPPHRLSRAAEDHGSNSSASVASCLRHADAGATLRSQSRSTPGRARSLSRGRRCHGPAGDLRTRREKLSTDRFNQTILRLLQEGHNLRTCHRRKSVEEVVNGLACFQIVEQCLHGNACSVEHRRTTHDFRIAGDDGLLHPNTLFLRGPLFNTWRIPPFRSLVEVPGARSSWIPKLWWAVTGACARRKPRTWHSASGIWFFDSFDG